LIGDTLKFLADECCDTGLVASLRKDGHNVLYITEEKAGAIDDEILSPFCGMGTCSRRAGKTRKEGYSLFVETVNTGPSFSLTKARICETDWRAFWVCSAEKFVGQ
jgi:hypothetical protein